MARALNVLARGFALRYLFLAEPLPGYPVASLSVRELAAAFCESRGCPGLVADGELPHGCRKHVQAMLLGVSKMVAAGEAHAELSFRGVVFVRLSPAGVLLPESWSSVPKWWSERPDRVEWARAA